MLKRALQLLQTTERQTELIHATVVSGLEPPEADCDPTPESIAYQSGGSHQSARADYQDPPQPYDSASLALPDGAASVLTCCAKRRVALGFGLLLLALVMFALMALPTESAAKQTKKKNKEICITLDELPAAGTFGEVDAVEINTALLAALKKHEVHAAGFVVGASIDGNYDLLGAWLNDGHVLGNLTYSHQDLHVLGAEGFIHDLAAGEAALEPMLEGFGQDFRYFRYPFLHYGNTVEEKREVKRYLTANDIVVAHATVVVEDYLYDLSLQKLGDNIDSADYFNLRDDYLEHVLDQLHMAETDAMEVLKRPCRQILMLRANRLNAEYLDDILTLLQEEGYRFITLDQALEDKLYQAPEAYFGARGVGYIEMIRDSNTDLLPAQ